MNLNVRSPERAVFVHHVGAGNVAGHQVGRELNPVELERQALGQRADHQRFGQARHALQNAMPAGEQADQKLLDDFFLADDDAGHLLADGVAGGAQPFEPGQVFTADRRVRGFIG